MECFYEKKDVKTKAEFITFDVRKNVPLQVIVPPVEDMTPYESDYLWKGVKHYLDIGQIENATKHKFGIEDKQRVEAQYLKEKGIKWGCQYYRWEKTRNLWMPKTLNLTLYNESEPPLEMPPPFQIPVAIQQVLADGKTIQIDELYNSIESEIQGSPTNQTPPTSPQEIVQENQENQEDPVLDQIEAGSDLIED